MKEETIARFRLVRTATFPVEFDGTLLQSFHSSNFKFAADTKKRRQWFEAYLYRTRGGKLVLNIRYRFNGFTRERPYDAVLVSTTNAGLVTALEAINVQEWIVGSSDVEFKHWDDQLRHYGGDQWDELLETLQQHLTAYMVEKIA